MDSIHLALYIASISFLASSLYLAVMAASTSGKFHLRHITCHVGVFVHPAKIIAGRISSNNFFIFYDFLNKLDRIDRISITANNCVLVIEYQNCHKHQLIIE